MAALLFMLLFWAAADTTAQTTRASITVQPTVSLEDADLVAEGIRLGQDFFTREIGATIDSDVQVSVMAGAHPADSSQIALSIGPAIAIYTGSAGWRFSSPAEKVRTVVHEYTHYYQYLMTSRVSDASPAWFEEGLAEFLSVIALDQLEILDRLDTESSFA
jgi:hypothetical protein